MIEGFSLIATGVDVTTFLDRVAAGERPELDEQLSFVAVWRHQHTVWRRSVSEAAHLALATLAAGRTVADALDAALSSASGDSDSLEGEVFAWFGQWLEDGLVSAVLLPTREIRSES